MTSSLPKASPPTHTVHILLSGGPHAGKTSILHALQQSIPHSLECPVIVIPEAATSVISNTPPSVLQALASSSQTRITFQQRIIHTQIQNETLASLTSLNSSPSPLDKPTIFLYDRGILDGQAFTSPSEWSHVITTTNTQIDPNTFRIQGAPPYDLVIHLTSTACSSHDNTQIQYALSSDETQTTRIQAQDEAAASDHALRHLYSSHPNWQFVPVKQHFSDKVLITLNHITAAVAPFLP